MKYLASLFLLLNVSLGAAELKVGVSQTNSGRVSRYDIANILKCTSGNKAHNFSFQSYPNLRGVKYVEEKIIDAFYPVHVNHKNVNHSLLPIYIDEVLLISHKVVDKSISTKIGAIRGEHKNIFEKNKNYKLDFQVEDPIALVRGFISNRVPSILIYRSQLPPSIDISKFHIETIVFQDVGIQINEKFTQKFGRTREQLQTSFVGCILDHDFKLSNIRKGRFICPSFRI